MRPAGVYNRRAFFRREADKGKRLQKLKRWARALKQDILVLYFAYQDPRVPWFARLLTLCLVAYALSPIDLIPDFIPVLGYLDDLILVPLGVFLMLKLIPQPVIDDCRVKAQARLGEAKPKNWVAAGLIITVWIVLTLWVGYSLMRLKGSP